MVDNDVAASLLMKNNSFGYNVSLIPNNKVSYPEVSKEVLDYVKRVTRGKAQYALELIKYHPHVESSIKYIFGNVLVCEDQETAKRLAFDPCVRMKTVTLEGDIYDPSGIIIGGYSEHTDLSVLRKVKDI